MATAIYQTRGIEKIGNFLQDVQYHSLMVNSASFNVRLMRDRKTRLPFLDSQTGVAQNSCKLYVDSCHRMPGILFGQIYAYPAQRWCRKKRSYITIAYHTARETAEATEQIITAIENPPVSNITEEINAASMETKPQHEMFFYDESNFLEEEDDEPDNEDDDTYSMRNTKKKKKCIKPPKPVPTKSTRGRKRRDPSTYKIITDADDDNPGKPYECALCGARYKTRQGLSYHLSHTHREGVNSSSTPCKNLVSLSQSESLGSDGSIILTEQNFPYQEQPQLISKQPDALSGLTDFQDNYLGYLSSSQESSTSATASNYEPAVRRIVEAVSEDDSLPFKEDSSESKLTAVERPLDAPEAVFTNNDEEFQKSNMKQLNSLPCNKIGDIATPNSYCDFCLGNANFNIKTGEPEEMVSCADCGRSGHLTCLQFTPNMIISVRHYRWQCIECKCCSLCGTSENDDKLLFCDDCDRGYHLYCLDKPLSEPPEGEWSCHLCQTQFHTKKV